MIKAILTAADIGGYDAEASMDELEELAHTAGAEAVARVIQKRSAPDSATVLGEGKLEEIAQLCNAEEVELVIFDTELSGSQIRNIEKALDRRVIDRTMLILDIFAGRAVSSEGKLQVELAQLRYRLPRLTGMGTALSRLGGGIGTRGPGETQLESDRRHIRRRVSKLSEELAELETRRGTARARRKKDDILTGAIVGYTNAGKSTLLNALTGAGVLAEDKLFATLDLTSRMIELPDGRSLMLVDTVGLIRRLPHHLVEAFKSTLEEAASADIILHVCDSADPEAAEKARTTEEIVAELCEKAGRSDVPMLNILNKCDKLPCGIPEDDRTVKISAKTGEGFARMLELIAKNLPEGAKRLSLLLPYEKAGIAARIRQNGKVFTEDFTEEGVRLDALVDVKLLAEVEQYRV